MRKSGTELSMYVPAHLACSRASSGGEVVEDQISKTFADRVSGECHGCHVNQSNSGLAIERFLAIFASPVFARPSRGESTRIDLCQQRTTYERVWRFFTMGKAP